jgi:hypothetical protein
MDEHRPRVLRNRVLGPKRDKMTGGLRKLHNGQGMWYEFGRRGMQIRYWWESQEVGGCIILKWTLER